jgi:hypothetical protein
LKLNDIGFGNNSFVKSALNHSSSLSYTVTSTQNRQKKAGKTVFDFDNASFYIPEDKTIKALTIYNKKGTSIFSVFLTAIVFCSAVILCIYYAPYIIQMFKNLL